MQAQPISLHVVFQYVKDTIWKQITTPPLLLCTESLLFFNTSKIQFESKSQRSHTWPGERPSCFSIRQRYNLKANHNKIHIANNGKRVVFQYVKDTIWKQITTDSTVAMKVPTLFFNTSKIQFESKSQQNHYTQKLFQSCFSIRQRYNLKANHNFPAPGSTINFVVFQYVKDTIWKQITTFVLLLISLIGCFSIRQRYNLKANHNII